MKTRPIIFSGSMVRALLDGRKTQTRRVLKLRSGLEEKQFTGELVNYYGDHRLGMAFEGTTLVQPVGFAPGDLLYVREAFNFSSDDELHPKEKQNHSPARAIYLAKNIVYMADGITEHPTFGKALWRPSIHMPRWASRLTLEVTDVRVERLQDISEADAQAEGVERDHETGSWWGAEGSAVTPGATPRFTHATRAFGSLWDSIYASRGAAWQDDPWVVALTFSVVRRNVDEVAS